VKPSECPRCCCRRMLATFLYARHEDTSLLTIEYTCEDCRLTYSEEEESWRDETHEKWEPPR